MDTGSPSSVARFVVDLAAGKPGTLGSARLICVDGPAGSGKTTLAAEIARLTEATVVHMDALMDGWDGAGDTGAQLEAILRPLQQGRPGRYRRFDWLQGRFVESISVPPSPWLIIEGVGSGNPVVSDLATLLVWVQVDDELRLRRGLARDGSHMEPQWRDFMPAETAMFVRDRTAERADITVDGTGRGAPIVRDAP